MSRSWSEADEAEATVRASASQPAGAKLGRYELVYEIGKGGMANVYLARVSGPAGFKKWFAIKRIHPHLSSDPRFVDMFLDEARISAALQHPNIAQVFDLGESDGAYYIAIEYMHGEHLGAVGTATAKVGGMRHEVAAALVAQAARGLHHAHEACDDAGVSLGLVHRDVSPQNIFVTYGGVVKVTDFGIAKAANRSTDTKTGEIKGKIAYMAPEQALGQPLDRRTDIFALGAVLWEQIAKRYLFRADTDAQTLLRITYGDIPSPTQYAPDCPPELVRITMKTLERLPSQRYPTAAALAQDLEQFVQSSGRPAAQPEIATLMHRAFTERMQAKDSVLRGEARSIPALLQQGSGELESSWSLARSDILTKRGSTAPTLLATPEPRRTSPETPTARDPSETPVLDTQSEVEAFGRHSSRNRWWVAAVTVIVLGGGAAAFKLLGDPQPPDASASAIAAESQPRGVSAPKPEQAQPHVAAEKAPPIAAPAVAAPAVGAVTPEAEATPSLQAESEPRAVATETERRTEEPRGHDRRHDRERGREREVRGRASLNLLSRPWAEVKVDGRRAGPTPLMGYAIPAGRVRVELQPEGRGPSRTIWIQADPGETVSRTVDLR